MVDYLKKTDFQKKKMARVSKLQNLVVSYCYKYLNRDEVFNHLDELTKRKKMRAMWNQLLILNKMYSIAVADLTSDMYIERRKIERLRDKLSDQTILNEEYKQVIDILDTLEVIGWKCGEAILNIAYTLRKLHMRLTENELRTSLSISEREWIEHCVESSKRKESERDLINILVVSQLGPRALSDQAMVAATHMMMSNPKSVLKAKLKAEQMFPALFN